MLCIFHNWISYSALKICTFLTGCFPLGAKSIGSPSPGSLLLAVNKEGVGSEGLPQEINLQMDRAEMKTNQCVSA